MIQWECAYGVRTHQRYTQRERRAMWEMGKREPALVLSLESFQYKEGGGRTGERKADGKVDGGSLADGS